MNIKLFLIRRKFIIDRQFQMELLFRAGFYSISMLVVMGVGVFYPMMREINSTDDAADAASAMLYMHRHFWPIAILCVVLMMIISVQLSHRIAGPLYRMRRSFDELVRGVFPRPATTRERDYLKKDVELLNKVSDSLAAATDEIKTATRELASALDSVEMVAREESGSELQRAVAKAQDKLQILERKANYFRRFDELPDADTAAVGDPAGAAAQIPASANAH